MTIRSRSVLTMIFAIALPSSVAANSTVSAYLSRAIDDPTRTAADKKLDADRRPAETLAAAGVHPGEQIAEYLPGGGYYTRLLSDVVGPKGKVYALETTTWGQTNIDATKQAINATRYPNVVMDLAPLGDFHLPGQVDIFWTTLNYHDLHVEKYAKVDMLAFNRHVYGSLKPGGEYFIVDHDANAATGATVSPTLHRIEKALVIHEVTEAGFKLAGESHILSRPTDDHTKVVTDPSIRWKTDQFVLLFRKP